MPKPAVRPSQCKPISTFRLVGVRGNAPNVTDSFILSLIHKAVKIPAPEQPRTPQGKVGERDDN